MKTLDIVHQFNDRRTHVSRGICRVRSFIGLNGTAVLLTDLGDKNDGQSVTNAVEDIIKSLLDQGYVIPPATFIEHYEGSNWASESFDKVILSPHTKWETLTRNQVLQMIGDESDELADRSDTNPRIVSQADRLLFRHDPFIGFRYIESNEVTKRCLEIVENMISKASIEELIQSGSGEQELQRLLKTDLSIFGEAYAKPDDEYICFSEFPVANGFVDFVVFTGRSRMDIILIEVKGADFNLLNGNHYKTFNHKIIEAAAQISQRLGIIFRDLNGFRKEAHAIRRQAEFGVRPYNAFLGPRSQLGVDPNKDINIRSVIIGGRTNNDLEESIKRQDFEAHTTPPVRVESWDTWLRRLQRT
jgi:hypothetical protein